MASDLNQQITNPGTTGTPAEIASSLALVLSPQASITFADGPQNAIPASVTYNIVNVFTIFIVNAFKLLFGEI